MSASAPTEQGYTARLAEGPLVEPHQKLIFLHIPKTAGTSVRAIVEQEYPQGACVQVYTNSPEFYETIREAVAKAKALYGHTFYGIHEWFDIDVRYIAFVRNPIHRVISFYNHQLLDKHSLHYEAIHDRGMTIRDMLHAGSSLEMNNLMVRIISGYGGTDITDDTALWDNAIANIERHFEFVGLTERMPESVNILAQRLGWGEHCIPRLNITPSYPEIDAATRATIKEYNRLDLMLYEYVEKHFPPNPDLFNGLGGQVRKFFGSRHARPGGLLSPGLFQTGPFADLVGQPISKFPIQEAKSLAVRVDTPQASTASDPQGSLTPAYITGRIQSEQTPLNPPPLALAINGTIRSLTQPWTFPVNGRYGRWCTVVPQASFRVGWRMFFRTARNSIEPFSVSVEAGRVVLLRPTAPFQNLAQDYPDTAEELVSPHGQKVRVEPGALQGWVDEAKLDQQQLELAGWVADIQNTGLPQAVWVVVNGRLIHTGQTTVSRPDVGAVLKTAVFQPAGFLFSLFLEETADLEVRDLEVRVFAVSKDGVASELFYPPGYAWRRKPPFKLRP